MPESKVTVNRYRGDHFTDLSCRCQSCRKPATVARILVTGPGLAVNLCAICLCNALDAINAAVIEDVLEQAEG